MKRVLLKWKNPQYTADDDELSTGLSHLVDALTKLAGGNYGMVAEFDDGWEEVYLTVPDDKLEPLVAVVEAWTDVEIVYPTSGR